MTTGGGIAKRTFTKSGLLDLESFRSVVDLNLIATFNMSRLSAAHMSKNEPEDYYARPWVAGDGVLAIAPNLFLTDLTVRFRREGGYADPRYGLR